MFRLRIYNIILNRPNYLAVFSKHIVSNSCKHRFEIERFAYISSNLLFDFLHNGTYTFDFLASCHAKHC